MFQDEMATAVGKCQKSQGISDSKYFSAKEI
jgi:hypothetical protein